jgi:hypothetical protein
MFRGRRKIVTWIVRLGQKGLKLSTMIDLETLMLIMFRMNGLILYLINGEHQRKRLE